MLYSTSDTSVKILTHGYDPLSEVNGLRQNGKHVPSSRLRVDSRLRVRRPRPIQPRRPFNPMHVLSSPVPRAINQNVGIRHGFDGGLQIFAGPARDMTDMGMGAGLTGLESLGKFSLKKAVKAVAKPVAQVAKIATAPVRVGTAAAANAVGIKHGVNKALALSKTEAKVAKVGSKVIQAAAITAAAVVAAPTIGAALTTTGAGVAKAGIAAKTFLPKLPGMAVNLFRKKAPGAQEQAADPARPGPSADELIDKAVRGARKLKKNAQTVRSSYETAQGVRDFVGKKPGDAALTGSAAVPPAADTAPAPQASQAPAVQSYGGVPSFTGSVPESSSSATPAPVTEASMIETPKGLLSNPLLLGGLAIVGTMLLNGKFLRGRRR